jgi:hypothetical protein
VSRYASVTSDRDLSRPQELRLAFADVANLAGGGDEPDAPHHAREALVADPGPVGGGRDRTSDVLGVYVALVLERQALLPQRLVELPDRRAGQRRRPLALHVGRRHAAEGREIEQKTVGLHDRGERMGGAGDPDRFASLRGLGDQRRHLVLP